MKNLPALVCRALPTFLLVVGSLLFLTATASAQCVSLTTLGSASTQNFDTLSNTAGSTTNNLTITGWFMTESGGGARDNEQYAVDTGASTTGDTYSYGSAASTERALGALRSGTLIPTFGACFTNNTGATIGSLSVAYNGEEWRLGTAARTDQINFEYSTTATDLVTGTWTGVAALNFVTPDTATTGAKNGNAAADRTSLSTTISSLSIANGATFWIRWTDTDASGADDGLSVDDFSLTPNGVVTLPNLTVNDVSLNEGNAGTTSFTFTVSLSAPAGAGGVTFDIATADNTAVAPGDYTQKSLTAQTIPAGSSTYSFTVLVNGDTTPETNETFFVNVTSVTGATVTDGQGQGTLVNDDSAPNLLINDVSLNEGNAGTTTFTFTVSLSAPAPTGGTTFDIATANNTAVAPGDFTANSLTSQTIPAGSSTYTFDVLVNGDTTPESDETFFVDVTSITGAIGTDTQGQGTIVNEDVALTPIHDIQGPGNSSPIVGSSVSTRGIVTGVRSNGFFIQEPDASVDADPATSEGVFVFTSSAPPVAAVVGNLVQVTATVSEFVPSQDPLQPPLTELTTPSVILVSSGNPLPAPIALTPSFPSPAGTYDQLERHEGMRVSAAALTVVAPTLGSINEANATATSQGVFFAVSTGVPRAFREAGIQDPDPAPTGTIPPIPRFDTNPEVIRIDSDGLSGTTAVEVSTGATLANVVGPLDYTFRHYTILPETTLTPTGGMSTTAVTNPAADEFTVAGYNLERFFDTVNDPSIGEPVLTTTAFNNRLAKASLGIRNYLKYPDIIGVVEVENLTTLQALASKISTDAVGAGDPDPLYQAYLVEGNDVGGIDVGFLVKTSIVTGATPRVSVTAVTQFNLSETFTNPDSSTSLLNDRPPLVLEAAVNHPNGASFPVVVIVNHLRSLGGQADTAAGTNGWATGGERVRAKRQKQAESLANLVQARQIANPAEHIVVLGDFNAFEVNDGYGDSMGTIGGTPVPDNQTVVPGDGVDLVNPDLTNLYLTPPAAERYSYVFDGNAQTLDHLLANSDLIADTLAQRIEHPRINSDFPETARNNADEKRLSDHDPVVGFFRVLGFASADLAITKTDSPDPVTAGTNLTYSVTVTNNGPNAAASAAWSDTLPAGTSFVSLSSPGGWSCTTPGVGSGGTVSCSNATFAVGSAAFTLTVAVAPSVAAGTVLSNTATTTATTADPTSGNNSATATTTVATSADLSVTKTDSPDPVTAGANLTYTITVTSVGPSNAATASLSDTLPAGLTFVSLSSPGGWSCSTPAVGAGGTVSCSNASLAIGSAAFTLVVAVPPATPAGTVISNTAQVSSATTDPVGANNNATATTTVAAVADLAVTKTDSPDPVTAGANLTYSINLTNVGPSNAATVALADTLPAGTTFVSLSSPGGWSCTTPAVGASGTVSCSNASLGLTAASFTLVVAVDAGVSSGTVISNTATVSTTSTDPSSANNSATTTTTVGAAADLTISKTDSPDPVLPGANITYSVTVQNLGPSSAANAAWADTLPAGTTFVSLASAGGWSCTTPAVGAGGTVNCSNASFAAGNASFTLVVAVGAAASGSISNTATVSAATTDPVAGNNSATATTAITQVADLSIVKTAGANPATAGANLTYTLALQNSGPSSAANAAFSDTLPAGTTFVSLSSPGGFSCSTPAVGSGGTVSCSAASFATGTANFSLVVLVASSATANSSIVNTATASSSTTDPDSGDLTSTATVSVIAPASLAATKTVGGSTSPGGTVVYVISLTNDGPADQQDNAGDELVDVLPAGLTLTSATASSGTALVNVGTNTVTWNGAVPVGGVVTLEIEAVVDSGLPFGTAITNQASLSWDGDGNGTNEASGTTDDPGAAGGADPTVFIVGGQPTVEVPTLDLRGLLALAGLLGALALWRLRR